jgi:hypothetical protein
MKPGKELAGTKQSERAAKFIVPEPAEGGDALASEWRLSRPGQPLG